jgi:2',3'-cyclic-nucleotide 2'-phosphodiesterase (5'-nucleotidase family)
VLVLDGGDSLWGSQPSPPTTRSQGLVVVKAMNLMGYDAMALGPTELQLGTGILHQLVESGHFPIVSANVLRPADHDDLEDPPWLAPYTVVRAGDVPVGIVGLTRIVVAEQFGFLMVVDPAPYLPRYMQELEPQTDIVIVLSSLGWDDNLRLAEAAAGIDLIIGSSGTSVVTQRWQSGRTGTVVWQLGTQAWENPGRTVQVIKLTVDDRGQVTGYSGSTAELGPDITDDAEMRALLDSYEP